MSFELEKENIRIYQPLKAANVKTVVDTDIIVPDTKPDVLNILDVSAISSIEEKKIKSDKISVSGNVQYNVLYSGGEENVEVRCIRYKVPFSEEISVSGAEEGMTSYAVSNVDHVEFGIQNSRKINVKSVISFDCAAASRTLASSVASVESDTKLPVKKEKLKALDMAVCCQENFFVTDEIRFSENSAPVDELLKTDVRLVSREIKPMNNKLVVKGSLITDILYCAEGELYRLENESPFTEVIDAEGLTSDMHTDIKYSIHSIDCDITGDEADKYISFEGNVDVLVKAFVENEHEIISDAFCPDYETEILRETHTVLRVEDSYKENFSLNEMTSLSDASPDILRVHSLSVTPHTDTVTAMDGYATIEGYLDAKLLYMSGSNSHPLCMANKKLPYSLRVNNKSITADTDIDISVSLEHSGYVLKSEKDFEIRAALKADGKIISQKQVEIISDICVNEEKPLSKENQPGIVIYFADEGESLWEISKRYNTTIDELAQINSIETDAPIAHRQQLIIPKRRII